MIINEKAINQAGVAIPVGYNGLEVDIGNHHYSGTTYGPSDKTCDTYNKIRAKSSGEAIKWLKANIKGQLKNIDHKFHDGKDSHRA